MLNIVVVYTVGIRVVCVNPIVHTKYPSIKLCVSITILKHKEEKNMLWNYMQDYPQLEQTFVLIVMDCVKPLVLHYSAPTWT